MTEQNAYILGTDQQELYRLGLQHQVWATEAQKGWALAGFNAGHTILDLGSGPGFCTKELAYITGPSGKVIAIDLSENYIQHLDALVKLHHLNVESYVADFNDMNLEPESLDGMFCRWALAWLPNPEEILQKVYDALKPGARMVIHEYYDWSTHQSVPNFPGLDKAIAAAMRSFKEQEGEIDVGREVPGILSKMGMKLVNLRPMAKLGRPDNLIWQWPRSFYESYFPRLIEAGYLEKQDVEIAFEDLKKIEANPAATLCCPLMIEIIAEK